MTTKRGTDGWKEMRVSFHAIELCHRKNANTLSVSPVSDDRPDCPVPEATSLSSCVFDEVCDDAPASQLALIPGEKLSQTSAS